MIDDDYSDDFEQIALVGIAGRYPSSPDIRAFWENIRKGRDCLRTFSESDFDEVGISAKHYGRSNFVPRGSELPEALGFDARFFGFTPQEASMMDPQSRIFLETCWEALEDSGYQPNGIDDAVGVFAGSNPNDYAALLGVADPSDSLTAFNQLIGSDKDFLATRVSHRLNLRGPALTLQTACSTSLVAVHLAAQSLLNYECTMALAGGVTVNFRQGLGYFAQPGMILSPAGTCRAFDAEAEGTTLGQGCGVAVLKRLSDAIADDDHIYAVVKATAINNDGASKISYTAPSEDGQAEVISLAHQLAGIESDSIGYVEAHGTGTKLGDPVEVAALTRAFKPGTHRTQFCAIGSAKTNFGHTDAAAGITGFLKAALALHHGELPPSIHFETPNPAIGFEDTPFFVNTELREWSRNGTPRRAGVSAFGIGGTNAHVILEEAPERTQRAAEPEHPVILPISAKTSDAADSSVVRIQEALGEPRSNSPIDAAFTLRQGRASYPHRRALVTASTEHGAIRVSGVAVETPTIVGLYPGQGMQKPGMTAGLYECEPVYRHAFDACIARFEDIIKRPLRHLILDAGERSTLLDQTWLTQPALFTVEYALTQLMESWGVSPDVVIGHSIGEFAAGTHAGIFSLDDATRIVAERGRLMWAMEPGSMASVLLSADELAEYLPNDVHVAALNAPNMTVVSGPTNAIEAVVEQLSERGARSTLLATSHAFHSPMMEDAAAEFESFLNGVALSTPQCRMASNVTGTWLTDEQATSPAYWASQIRKPVRFSDCVSLVADDIDGAVFIELGPGHAMTTLTQQNPSVDLDDTTCATITVKRQQGEQTEVGETVAARAAVAALWCAGVTPDWEALGQQGGRRVPLPTYPFERVEHWAPARRHQLALPQFGELTEQPAVRRNPADQWLWAPTWTRLPYDEPRRTRDSGATTVAFLPSTEFGDQLRTELIESHGDIVSVRPSELFVAGEDEFLVRPGNDEDLADLAEELRTRGTNVDTIVHAWTMELMTDPDAAEVDAVLDAGLHSLLSTARHLSTLVDSTLVDEAQLIVATTGSAQAQGDEVVVASNAALAGAARVIGLEFPALDARVVDLANTNTESRRALITEIEVASPHTHVAIRGCAKWVPDVVQLPASTEDSPGIRAGGHYLIVGGTGGVGLSLATHLASAYGAKLSLTGRSGYPRIDEASSAETRRRVDVLKSLDETGQLAVFSADASSTKSMRTVIQQAEARFGRIHGVISAAGVADQGGMIQRRSTDDMRNSISSKVHGGLVLSEVFDDYDLDFLVLSSSVAATLWHNRFAQVGYVVANAFVESLPLAKPQLPLVTIAWDDWTEIGMSVRAAEDFAQTYGEGVDLVDELNSFTPTEGIRVFEHVLALGQPVQVVSPTDLRDRIRDDVHAVSPFLSTAVDGDASGEPNGGARSVAEVLTSAWSDLLGYEEVEDDADFFNLGGDSLQAARLADRVSRGVGVDVPLQMIFANSTKAEMIAAVELLTTNEPSSAAISEERTAPLGPAQIRFLQRKNPNIDHFNISTLLEPSGVLDPDALEQAIRVVVGLHPALRTMIDIDQSEQRVLDAEDWQHFSRHEVKNTDELYDFCQQRQRSLHLRDGHVFDVSLIDVRETGEVRIFLVMHHMVSDRISLLLLIDSISELHSLAVDRGTLPDRPPPSFGVWTSKLEVQARNGHAADAEASLMALPWEDVEPLRTSDVPNRNRDGNAVRVELGAELSRSLLESDVGSVDELLLAGLFESLAEWTGGEAASVETVNHGRRLFDDVDVSRSVGFFLSYLPLVIGRESMCNTETVVEEIRRQKSFNQLYDPLRFYGEAPRNANISGIRRPDVLFNYVGRPISAPVGQAFRPTNERRGDEVDPDGNRDHAIAVMAEVDDTDQITLIFVHSLRLHSELEITCLADTFTRQVNRVLSFA